eukprot:364208-Chlamydomonas_euryale.AAC.3
MGASAQEGAGGRVCYPEPGADGGGPRRWNAFEYEPAPQICRLRGQVPGGGLRERSEPESQTLNICMRTWRLEFTTYTHPSERRFGRLWGVASRSQLSLAGLHTLAAPCSAPVRSTNQPCIRNKCPSQLHHGIRAKPCQWASRN